jgi:hypothetical protein
MVVFAFFGVIASASVSARILNSSPSHQPDAQQLARDLFQNEIQAENQDQSLWCYRERDQEHGEKKLSAVCQTSEGEIDRLLEVNGQELNPKQRQAEDQRIRRMLNDPDQMGQRSKKQQEDARQAHSLMRMVPDAFLFQYQGRQGSLIKLSFSPNPNFHPSGRPAQVFHHMEGDLLFDAEQQRLAEINGRLTSEVKFGWGLFGHLDKGGTFLVKQQDLGSRHWEITLLDVSMNGKALFFKTIAVRENRTYTDFRREPDRVSPQQAFEFLLQDPAFQ